MTYRSVKATLEEEATGGVSGADGADHAMGASVLRPFDRYFEEHRAELLSTMARRDQRPEEVRVLEAG